MVEMKMKGR